VKKDKTTYIIQKVIQALDILEQFHDDVAELSHAELGKRVEMTATGLTLMLGTLRSRSYLEQDRATECYRLGFKTLELGQAVLRQTDIYRVSHPVLASMEAACGENCAVSVLRKSYVIELDSVQSEHPVQVVKRVGVHLPVHCTAAGKMLVACEGEDAAAALFANAELERYTAHTMTDPEQLQLQLREAMRNGYAVDDEELDPDVRSVAAAVRDYAGKVVGAVVITGPCCRVDRERIVRELAPLAQKGAREISFRLGFHETEIAADAAPARQKKVPGAAPRPAPCAKKESGKQAA
jgi:DNA-binding IclR family transcriptional regulator